MNKLVFEVKPHFKKIRVHESFRELYANINILTK